MTEVKAAALGSALAEAGIGFDVLEHERTDTAAGEARALGLRTAEVAKTIVVRTPDGDVRVVIASGRPRRHAPVARARRRRQGRAPRDRRGARARLPGVRARSGAARGWQARPVLVDRRVAELETVVLEAGVHDQSIRMEARDLVRVADARVVDIVEG